MTNWKSRGRLFLSLKAANIIALIFWVVFFIDGFLPSKDSIEVVRDFDEFALPRGGTSSYKKLITDYRTFTTYADENGFFITDTLELKLTPIFGLVVQYRQFSPFEPQKWIYHELSSHHKPIIVLVTIGLFLLTMYAVFFDNITREKYKAISLFTISGTFMIYLSLVT